MSDPVKLLQFIICKSFRTGKQDFYNAEGLHSNIYAPRFPFEFEDTYAVTCWRKDERFHKEVIEYETADGTKKRSPHMDIEPVAGSVLFRWHKHRFPADLIIKEPTVLTLRVILDWEVHFESLLMIEKAV